MHFFDWNIGDYAKKTQHLTNDEDLAYRRLLDMYYDTEQPITHGLATLSRRLRIDEKSIKNVLDEFFPNGINKHADEKIAAYHAYLEKQKLNGSKGGRPTHKPTDNPVVSQNNPVPSQPLTTNHELLTTNQDLNTIVPNGTPDCPHERIVSAYHELLPTLSGVRILTYKRKALLKARWRDDEKRQSLEWWEKYFKYVSTIPFLLGENDRHWQVDFEWLINSSNLVKVIEGKYENRKS